MCKFQNKNIPDILRVIVWPAKAHEKCSTAHHAKTLGTPGLDEEDKFAKLRPIIKLLNQKFQRHSPNEEFYSFDESMCEYYGRHGCKQFLRGKPIRFGFKIWCGTTPLGYLIWFDPYQGKSASSRPQDNGLGLGGNLVSHFADVLTACFPTRVRGLI